MVAYFVRNLVVRAIEKVLTKKGYWIGNLYYIWL